MEGKSIKEATQQLGWRQGTLAGRLARGRKMLAKRLAKPGFALSAASLATIASYDVASAGVTETLVHSTVATSGLVAAGGAAIRGVASARVAALAEGVKKAMRYSKVKIASVIVLAATFLLGGSDLFPSISEAGQKKASEKRPANPDKVAKDSGFKPGEVREFEIAPGVKMKFCWIPPGEVQLGAPDEEQCYVMGWHAGGARPGWTDSESEGKCGKFVSKGFWLGKYAVTQGEWQAIKGRNPSWFAATGGGSKKVAGMDASGLPVERVAWKDCADFLAKLNERAGKEKIFGKGRFVLPHENEWEVACRGGRGNATPFYFGKELDGKQANCDAREGRAYRPPFAMSASCLKAVAALSSQCTLEIKAEDSYPVSYFFGKFHENLQGTGFYIRINEPSLKMDLGYEGPIKIYGDESPRIRIRPMPGATWSEVMAAVLKPLNLVHRIREDHVEVLRKVHLDEPDDRVPSYLPASPSNENYKKAVARLKEYGWHKYEYSVELSFATWMKWFNDALRDSKFDVRINESLLKEKPELNTPGQYPRVRIQAMQDASLESVMMEVLGELDLTFTVHGDFIEIVKIDHTKKAPRKSASPAVAVERTTEVGKYEAVAPHPWGLCDMHGNVWQWCENWYDGEHLKRAVRGGSWNSGPADCRSAHRVGALPDYTSNDCGFRVCFRPE